MLDGLKSLVKHLNLLWKKGELVQVRSHYEGRAFIKNQSVIVRGNILDGVFRLGTAEGHIFGDELWPEKTDSFEIYLIYYQKLDPEAD